MSKSKLFQVLKSNAKPTHVLLSYNTIIVQDILIVFGLMEKRGDGTRMRGVRAPQ